jgi:hypothetical protein
MPHPFQNGRIEWTYIAVDQAGYAAHGAIILFLTMMPETKSRSQIEAGNRAGAALGTAPIGQFQVGEWIVESTVPLPELTPATDGIADCRFEVLPAGEGLASEHKWFRRISPDNQPWISFADSGEDCLVRFHDQGDFLIARDGKNVMCQPLPGTAESTIRHLFLDQIIPLLLSRIEPLVLHASAVLTADGVVAFVGKSGQGKSTLAACFGRNGFRIISDDYLVLRHMAPGAVMGNLTGKWSAVPSYPGVRLWPETSEGIFSVPAGNGEIADYTDKRRVSDPKLVPFARGASVLRCLCFLTDDEETSYPGTPMIASLAPKQAFVKLVRCTFNLDVRDNALLERQFAAIGQICAQTHCFALDYVRDFAHLPEVTRLIVEQAARSAA